MLFNNLSFRLIISIAKSFVKTFGCGRLKPRGNMGVSIKSYLNAGMAQSFLNNLRMYALFKHKGSMAMPGVM